MITTNGISVGAKKAPDISLQSNSCYIKKTKENGKAYFSYEDYPITTSIPANTTNTIPTSRQQTATVTNTKGNSCVVKYTPIPGSKYAMATIYSRDGGIMLTGDFTTIYGAAFTDNANYIVDDDTSRPTLWRGIIYDNRQ